MALNTFIGVSTNNWGLAANWSQLAVPTANDGFITTFDALSPNCTVDTTGRVANIIDFTNYTNTITMTNIITVSGNVTLGASMVIAGASLLGINAAATLTSNGKAWPNTLSHSAGTITFADNWTVANYQRQSNTSILNGNTLSITGNLTVNIDALPGTTSIKMIGTGTWSGPAIAANSLEINTAGTITISGSVAMYAGTFLYTAGTVITSGSTVAIGGGGGVVTMDTKGSSSTSATTTSSTGINFNILNLLGVITNNSTICALGDLILSFNVSGSSVYANAGFTGIATTAGTSLIVLQGTGTWSTSTINNPIQINTAGTITITGTIQIYNNVSVTWVAGTVITAGSTLITGGGGNTITYNTNGSTAAGATTTSATGINWNNVTLSGGSITTLSSAFCVVGTLSITGIFNTSNIYCNGNLTVPGTATTGTSLIIMNGTGTWSGSGTLSNNLTFNTAGTITVSGTVKYSTGTITYTAGTVVTTSSTLTITGSCTLNTNGVNWNNVTVTGTTTITLTSVLTALGSYSLPSGTATLNGSTFNIGGSASFMGTSGIGTTNMIMNGTGTLSGSFPIKNNFTVNTAGIITFLNFEYADGTFTYIAGTVVISAGASTWFHAGAIINSAGIIFRRVVTSTVGTITLTSNLTTSGEFITGTTGNNIINGFAIFVGGDLTIQTAANLSGTANITMTGTGTWSGIGVLSNNLNISAPGSAITIGPGVKYSTGTFTYVTAGKVSSTTINFTSSCTLIGINKINFTAVTVTAGITLTMDKFFDALGATPTTITSATPGTRYNITATGENLQSQFVSVRDCNATRTGSLMIDTINANKGNNVGVLFLNNGFQGFQGDYYINNRYNFHKNAFYNNWGQGFQGFVRNS